MAGQHLQRIKLEVALFDNSQKFLSDGAGDPGDGNVPAHFSTPVLGVPIFLHDVFMHPEPHIITIWGEKFNKNSVKGLKGLEMAENCGFLAIFGYGRAFV
jgi:hypothetical protein